MHDNEQLHFTLNTKRRDVIIISRFESSSISKGNGKEWIQAIVVFFPIAIILLLVMMITLIMSIIFLITMLILIPIKPTKVG